MQKEVHQGEYTSGMKMKARQMKSKQSLLDQWLSLESLLQGLSDVPKMSLQEREILAADIEKQITTLEKELHKAKEMLYLSGSYDANDAVLEIHAGNGGDDAEDFVAILLRMYLRYIERKGWKATIVEETRSDAGVKSVSIDIEGEFVYGHLKHEKGNHKLYRKSPFKSTDSRQTSFAKVVVIPLIEDSPIEIREDALEITTTRSSGAGGQKVNKTDSAVRIRHIPSGIVVHCQTERSQLQNKQQALSILKSKLFLLEKEKQEQKLSSIKGKEFTAGFGSQAIRMYIFDNPKKVKDNRTGAEVADVQSVLDGYLDPFVEAELFQLS